MMSSDGAAGEEKILSRKESISTLDSFEFEHRSSPEEHEPEPVLQLSKASSRFGLGKVKLELERLKQEQLLQVQQEQQRVVTSPVPSADNVSVSTLVNTPAGEHVIMTLSPTTTVVSTLTLLSSDTPVQDTTQSFILTPPSTGLMAENSIPRASTPTSPIPSSHRSSFYSLERNPPSPFLPVTMSVSSSSPPTTATSSPETSLKKSPHIESKPLDSPKDGVDSPSDSSSLKPSPKEESHDAGSLSAQQDSSPPLDSSSPEPQSAGSSTNSPDKSPNGQTVQESEMASPTDMSPIQTFGLVNKDYQEVTPPVVSNTTEQKIQVNPVISPSPVERVPQHVTPSFPPSAVRKVEQYHNQVYIHKEPFVTDVEHLYESYPVTLTRMSPSVSYRTSYIPSKSKRHSMVIHTAYVSDTRQPKSYYDPYPPHSHHVTMSPHLGYQVQSPYEQDTRVFWKSVPFDDEVPTDHVPTSFLLFGYGFLFFPLWWVGACLPLDMSIPLPLAIRYRTWNRIASFVSVIVLACILSIVLLFAR